MWESTSREFGAAVDAEGSVAFGTPHEETLAFAAEAGRVMGTHG